MLNIYIWIRSGEWLKCVSGSQKSNLERKVLWSKKKGNIFISFLPNASLRGACKEHIYSSYSRRKCYQFFKNLAFIDLRVIRQHTEKALKTPLMPSGSTPPWPTSLLPTPFFLISTDMFEAHARGRSWWGQEHKQLRSQTKQTTHPLNTLTLRFIGECLLVRTAHAAAGHLIPSVWSIL